MAERERRLTTIVAIDVAAYSRLMHADEAGTLDRMRAARAITDPIAKAHGARIVGSWGDGLLVEFPSVVHAVEFAREAQAVTVLQRLVSVVHGHGNLHLRGLPVVR